MWVVVPAYNEQRLITSCLDALRNQSDPEFTLVVVDNGSTDNTAKIVRDYARMYPGFDLRLISEKQKGTGAACDTGIRYAIKHGAKCVARTDADALAHQDWTKTIRRHYVSGKLFMAGRLHCRTDEPGFRKFDLIKATIAVYFAEFIAKQWHNGPQYHYRMFMAAGLNLAIDAKLYERCGGFPRSSIEDTDEDLELHLKVRRILDKKYVVFDPKMIVYGSPRRAKAYGYINILLWYWERRYTGDVIDIR